MSIPVMRVIVLIINAKLLLLLLMTVSVVHICSLTGECSAIFAPRLVVAASGVGDVGFLTNVLLAPQLKTNLILEGKLALSG